MRCVGAPSAFDFARGLQSQAVDGSLFQRWDGAGAAAEPQTARKLGSRARMIREASAAATAEDGNGNGSSARATGSKSSSREWSEDDEARFVGKLEEELDKVHTKQQVKAMEISRRIAVSEREVRDVVNRLNERGPRQEGPSEEEFMLLEEDLSDIIADVHDLAKFVQLNYTGFYKIIKKHDVRRPRPPIPIRTNTASRK